MGYTKVTTIFVLALSLAHAFHKLVPADKELVYKYRALVKAGTQLPVPFASQFVLEGFIHVQSGTNSTYVRLSDLKYHLYNGELDHVKEVEGVTPVPIPPEVQDLLRVFKVVYDDSGKAIGISTEEQEKVFSRNIKKAIGAVLQLDVDHLGLQTPVPHAFVTEEQSIYGKGATFYNVVPYGEDIHVQKMHEMATTHHMYHHMMTNIEPYHCESPYEEPMSHDSQRKYKIAKREGHHVVEHIEADGGIYNYPLKGKSEAFYLYVNQTMHLTEVVPVQQRYQVSSEHYENDLTYFMTDLSVETGAISDITNGRRVVDMQKVIPVMNKMLEDIVKYMHEDHIHTKTPDIKRGQLINRIRRVLSIFDLHSMEQAYEALVLKHTDEDVKALEVFHHILPLVGTRASLVHIKNLVVKNKVNEHVAVEMLQSMSINVKVSNQTLLTEMEELIHLPSTVSWNVRKTAVLSFGTLVHKFVEMEKRIHKGHHGSHSQVSHAESADHHHDHDTAYHYDHQQSESHETEKSYEKYVTEFINRVKATQDNYKELLVNMAALLNMKLHSIATHLEPAVRGEWWHCHHRRLLAMWVVSGVVGENPEKTFKFYWPILTNKNEHKELRMMAYFLIMESQPTISRLLNIFWYLHNEQDEELYHFHYTYWHTTAKSKNPCESQTKLHVAQISKYMHKPSHGLSRYHQIDYTDMKIGVGGGWSGMWVKTNSSEILTAGMDRHIFNVPYEEYSFYIKIDGLEGSIADKFKLNTESQTKLFFNYDEILNIFTSIPNNKDIHIEVVQARQTQIVKVAYYDGTNAKDLASLFDFFSAPQYSYVKDFIDIEYELFSKVVMPSDLGIPAFVDLLIPAVHQFKLNVTKEVTNKITTYHMDNHWNIWRHSRHGISFYNPFLDVWQGINKYHSFDSALPLLADVTVNPQQQSMKISVKKHGDVHKDTIGLRSHVATMVFVKDDMHRNILTESCKHCQDYTYVSHGEEYRRQHQVLNKEDTNTGYHYNVSVYDHERQHISVGGLNNIIHQLSMKYDKNYMTTLGHMILNVREVYANILLQPSFAMNGLMIKATPSTVIPVSNVDLSLRLNREVNHENSVFNPAMKVSARATYAIKNEEKALKTWDVNAIVDLNAGHTLNTLKMQITRIIPGQKDFKVCVDGVKKWSHEGVTGHVNVALGQTADGKCAKDDTVVDVTMTGVKSQEQMSPHHVYGDCLYPKSYEIEEHHPLSCLVAHTSVRDYTYDVKTSNVPSEFKKSIAYWLEIIKARYLTYYIYVQEHTENIPENNIKVKVHYPTVGNQLGVYILTPHHGYAFDGVPTEDWPAIFVQPDNTHYSKLFMFMHAVGLTNRCHIYLNSLHTKHHSMPYQVPNEWTMFIGDAAQDAKHAVLVKKIDDKVLGVKVIHKEHSIEVVPHEHTFQVTMNGQKLAEEHHEYVNDWVHMKMYHGNEFHQPIVTLVLPHYGVHVEHDGDHIHVEMPKMSGHYFGHCISNH